MCVCVALASSANFAGVRALTRGDPDLARDDSARESAREKFSRSCARSSRVARSSTEVSVSRTVSVRFERRNRRNGARLRRYLHRRLSSSRLVARGCSRTKRVVPAMLVFSRANAVALMNQSFSLVNASACPTKDTIDALDAPPGTSPSAIRGR